MLESPAMDGITKLIEWLANDWGDRLVNLFPYCSLGLAALYLAMVVLGYLRVSQVAIEAEARDEAVPPPRCRRRRSRVSSAWHPVLPGRRPPVPGRRALLRQDESELLVACANCGATIRAADETCYRCGTRATLASVSEH